MLINANFSHEIDHAPAMAAAGSHCIAIARNSLLPLLPAGCYAIPIRDIETCRSENNMLRILKYASFAVSLCIVLLISSTSGCLTDPYSAGNPDSLFSEYILVWDLVDEYYACFIANENVDWDEAFQKFKPAAQNLQNRDQLIDVCLDLLGELEDENLVMRDSSGTRHDSHPRTAFVNWDMTVWIDYMEAWLPPDSSFMFDAYGAIAFNPSPSDTLGYVYISDLSSSFDIISFFWVTSAIQYCSGAIFDLRMCGESGVETSARNASGRFIGESTLSYYRAFRAGPGRDQMTEMQQVLSYRNGAWQFTEPLILLTGRNTRGAAEQLVMHLMTQQNVTVIGDTTAGYANPALSCNLLQNWTVEIPQMVTYLPDSTLVYNHGIPPEICIAVTEADFLAGIDPVLDAAVEMLMR